MLFSSLSVFQYLELSSRWKCGLHLTCSSFFFFFSRSHFVGTNACSHKIKNTGSSLGQLFIAQVSANSRSNGPRAFRPAHCLPLESIIRVNEQLLHKRCRNTLKKKKKKQKKLKQDCFFSSSTFPSSFLSLNFKKLNSKLRSTVGKVVSFVCLLVWMFGYRYQS